VRVAQILVKRPDSASLYSRRPEEHNDTAEHIDLVVKSKLLHFLEFLLRLRQRTGSWYHADSRERVLSMS